MMPVDTQSHYLVFPPSFDQPLLSISFPSDRPFSLPGDTSFVAPSHVREIAQGLRKRLKNVRGQGDSYRRATTISMLPDDVLLEIFDFYRNNEHNYLFGPACQWKWHLLVHVCRRWRQVVFALPLSLNLRILCTPITPVRKSLSIWPALPIFIDYHYYRSYRELLPGWRGNNASDYEDNVITALEHLDRVHDVRLSVTVSELEKITAVMQEPFPVLTRLHIVPSMSKYESVPVLPAKFLGGSAPCLQEIFLRGIPFPALPTLLLSARDLVTLDLRNIPSTGYISPQAMVAGLAASPRLKRFTIEFRSATPRPYRISPPPVTRTALPALTLFQFKGASEYLEDLVARIDGPQLNEIYIDYFNQFVDFQVAQLSKFVDRSVGPKLNLSNHGHVTFYGDRVTFTTHRLYPDPHSTTTAILCEGIDWQVSHIARVLGQLSGTLSNVVHLKLNAFAKERCHLEGTEVEWGLFLHQFSTAQTLRVSTDLAGHIALALKGFVREMTVGEALPSLDLIYLAGQQASSFEKFVAARQLAGRPVTVIDTEREFDERVMSYVSE